MDQLTFLLLFILPYFDEFFKNIFSSYENKNIFLFHPEYFLIFKNIIFYYYEFFLSNLYLSNYNLNINESYISSSLMVIQLLLVYFLVIIFLIVYFSYYNNYNSEDNTVDHDYLIYNVTIEAEEEIGSLDDMLLTSVILLYIFL